MGHQAAGWLERPEREREERTDLAVKALGLKPGDVVADIGCGTGYYASRMARIVGDEGIVYGVEIQQEMLDLLDMSMARLGITNVQGHMGEEKDPKLPAESCDLIIIVDVYHELEFPYEMTRSMINSLKPGGRMVLIEYRKEDPEVRIKECHKMTEAQVKKEMAIHPELAWVETFDQLPQQHLIIFKKQ
jgi:protein-L-isoaspartate O-methyltransferase